ncbi:MAG: radical SAM protein [Bacteroidetes bacterium]|nr:radical SAM protein [Bacteroidota bacterium]
MTTTLSTLHYRHLFTSGELKKRAEQLWRMMEQCHLCPRACRVNRHRGEQGVCKAPGTRLFISSYGPHYGEERPLVGKYGSGTIFFPFCNLQCIFCQNWTISHLGEGYEITIEELATIILRLQARRCHNINFVTPTHYVPHIVKALELAIPQGLNIPLVYNTSGWERVETLKLLEGIIDIYMPDFKYWDSAIAAKYSSSVVKYSEITQQAILEMHRQVGTAQYAHDGTMVRGLLIRHLILPNNVANSYGIIEWIATHLPLTTYVNIMSQYSPVFKAREFLELSRPITYSEYWTVVDYAKSLGLKNLDIQGEYLM